MRALIADDERAVRTMLRRMLEQLGVDADEAENGLELLAMLEEGKEPADFVIVDVDMPLLNGTDTLRAIRSSAKYRDMPVVCVSSSNDQDLISELIGIGVNDYLLKPIKPDVALPRLRNIIKNASRWRLRRPAAAVNELLLVDCDPNFLAFAKPILSLDFGVIESLSAIKAVAAFQQRSPAPSVVLVGEGLPLLSEVQLVETLRRAANRLEIDPPQVFLMTVSDIVDPDKAKHFHGVIKKTFVPDQFSAMFRRVVMRNMTPLEKLTNLLEGELQPELLSATQQTIGVLVGQEVFRLSPDQMASLSLPIRSTLAISDPESGAAIEFTILSDETSVVGMASKMHGSATSLANGAGDILGELVNTIAGRLRASLLLRDVDLRMGLPECTTDETPRSGGDWPRPAGYRCSGGEQFLIGYRVLQGAPDPTAAKPGPSVSHVSTEPEAAGADDVPS